MIAAGNRNFFTAHYDWLVAGAGVAALVAAGVFYALSLGEDADEAAAAAAAAVDRELRNNTKEVAAADLAPYEAAMKLTRAPVAVTEVSEKFESFLASERRVKCKCGKVISGDVKKVPKCPFCGAEQEVEKAVVLDADSDGLPDEWEKKYGLNPADAADANADKDGDDFTNAEEFAAKTDPTDRNDHPDYLASLTLTLPLKSTQLPFIFRRADKIPAGWRLTFFDSTSESATDRRKKGANVTALVGGEIAKTGYRVKSFAPKSEKRAKKGVSGKVDVDVSEAVVERISDGKTLTLVVEPKGFKYMAADVKATLVYSRGGGKTFDVVPGEEIDLSGTKYKVVSIKPVGKGAEVTLAHSLTAKKSVVKALE